MKHAEDWIKSFNGDFRSTIASVDIHDIKAIQRDAMQECAEIAKKIAEVTDSINAGRVHNAILQRMKELE